MSDNQDPKERQAKLETQALSGDKIVRQLWYLPLDTGGAHIHPLLRDYATVLIFLCRLHEDPDTTRIDTFLVGGGRRSTSLSPSEKQGDYNLSQLARETVNWLIREAQRLHAAGFHVASCIGLQAFENRILEQLLTKTTGDMHKAQFYYVLIKEKLETWKHNRMRTTLQGALMAEAFSRQCQLVFEKYLHYCRCWVDATPPILASGQEVSLSQVNIFLRNVENAQLGKHWLWKESELRNWFCEAVTAYHLRHGDGEIPHNDGRIHPGLSKCVEAYVLRYGADLKSIAERIMLQLSAPVCAACRVLKDLKKRGILNTKSGFCIHCELLNMAREYAGGKYTLEQSVSKMEFRLMGQYNYCRHCLKQYLSQIATMRIDI